MVLDEITIGTHVLHYWQAEVKGGLSYGATDELGYRSVEKIVTVHDLPRHDLAPTRLRSPQIKLPSSGTFRIPDRCPSYRSLAMVKDIYFRRFSRRL